MWTVDVGSETLDWFLTQTTAERCLMDRSFIDPEGNLQPALQSNLNRDETVNIQRGRGLKCLAKRHFASKKLSIDRHELVIQPFVVTTLALRWGGMSVHYSAQQVQAQMDDQTKWRKSKNGGYHEVTDCMTSVHTVPSRALWEQPVFEGNNASVMEKHQGVVSSSSQVHKHWCKVWRFVDFSVYFLCQSCCL